jgi:hypothetical protein
MKRCETKLIDFMCFIFIYITLQNTAKLHSNTLRAGLVPPAAAQPFRTTTSGVRSAAAWSPPSIQMLQLQIDDTNRFCYSDLMHIQTNKWEMDCQITLWLASWRRGWMDDGQQRDEQHRHRGCGLRRSGGEGLWATIRFAVAAAGSRRGATAAVAVTGWTRPRGKWQLWQNGKEPVLFFLSKKELVLCPGRVCVLELEGVGLEIS